MAPIANLARTDPVELDLPLDAEARASQLAEHAVSALIDEATLTPKPGLVDRRGSGAHRDLTLFLMLRSAESLRPAFVEMASFARGEPVGQPLREKLAVIGRHGEAEMMAATGGCNTHRGAIWALGLLIAGAAAEGGSDHPEAIAGRAGAIARHVDRFAPQATSNGKRASAKYGVGGARAEAEAGFPHAVSIGLPALRIARAKGLLETTARLEALLSIMASLNDTCLLHRGGRQALAAAQSGAGAIMAAGGVATLAGLSGLERLERDLLALNASPGGSADLLAATLFLDRLDARGARRSGSIRTWR